jgi:uncharacterized protein (TIGR00251 family)
MMVMAFTCRARTRATAVDHIIRNLLLISSRPDGVLIHVRVIPRSSKTAIVGTRDRALLVRLNAPPVDGAANAALIDIIAATLDVPKRAVSIVAGERGRTKHVSVIGISLAAACAKLGLEHVKP